MTDKNSKKGVITALLFASGEPIEISRIAEAAQLDKREVSVLLDEIKDELDDANSGLVMLSFDTRRQLATRPAYAEAVNRMLDTKRNTALSGAALEVLALVAYNQPVSRAFIDQVRGVDSSSPITTLLSRSLIREAGRLDLPGKPVSFEVTDTFLRCFDISSLDELPAVHGFEDEEMTD